jgi:hypothetical protein
VSVIVVFLLFGRSELQGYTSSVVARIEGAQHHELCRSWSSYSGLCFRGNEDCISWWLNVAVKLFSLTLVTKRGRLILTAIIMLSVKVSMLWRFSTDEHM